jgi:ribosomal protein L7/L12
MAELNQSQVIEYIKGISVLELSQLVKALESELGVSAAAAVAVAACGWRRRRRCGAGRREDRVQRHAHRSGRRQDQGHQGRT